MADESDRLERIRFYYERARHHRTYHVDGLWATITPQLEVQFAIYSNLRPLPKDITHRITPEGKLEEGEERRDQQSILREVDATIVMNRETVRATIELLQRMLSEVDKEIKNAREARGIVEDQASEVK
jgi:hypothetical protein